MKSLLLAFLLGGLAASADAQQTIDELFGTQAGDRFGASVAFVGDLDKDGNADFAVGAPGDDGGGGDAGRVTVYSGIDRSEIWHRDGLFAGGRLGESVDGTGDVDLDGYDDVIAGAPGVSQALVLSGKDGAILYDIAPSSGVEFGTSVAGIGNADGDAWPDFAVGAIGGTGLWVFSGRTGGLHWSDVTASLFLDGVGDVNADGYEDLIIGDNTYDSYGGRAIVFSGRNGAVIRQHLGDNLFSDQLGMGASGIGDVNGDDVRDYAYGVPCICFASHYVEVRSGATGGLIHNLFKYTIGRDVASAGDLDFDGTPDILATEPGTIFAFSGADKSNLFSYGVGEVVDGGADADGDGYLDYLGGQPLDDTGGNDAGRVGLYTLGCPPGAVYNYCTAVPNSTGAPAEIGWQNTTSIAANDFRLFATDCPADQFAMFFYGPGMAYAVLGDGYRCVSGPLFRLGVTQTGPTGVPSWPVDFTKPPQPAGKISAGETWFFQLWYRDPSGGPAGSNLSDGLRATFCP